MMCAAHRATNGTEARDVCFGDSGGALIIDGGRAADDIQIGVVSWGEEFPCDADDKPGVYARISEYYDWIRKTVCENSRANELSFDCMEEAESQFDVGPCLDLDGVPCIDIGRDFDIGDNPGFLVDLIRGPELELGNSVPTSNLEGGLGINTTVECTGHKKKTDCELNISCRWRHSEETGGECQTSNNR